MEEPKVDVAENSFAISTDAEDQSQLESTPTWGWAGWRLQERLDLCQQRASSHDKSAVFWQRLAAPLSWLTAVTAALSGLSVVAGNRVAAIILSIVTAVLAATNAAFHPAETAKNQRAASTLYVGLARRLSDAMIFRMGDWDTSMPRDKIEPTQRLIGELEEELKRIEDSHPPVAAAVPLSRPARDPESSTANP